MNNLLGILGAATPVPAGGPSAAPTVAGEAVAAELGAAGFFAGLIAQQMPAVAGAGASEPALPQEATKKLEVAVPTAVPADATDVSPPAVVLAATPIETHVLPPGETKPPVATPLGDNPVVQTAGPTLPAPSMVATATPSPLPQATPPPVAEPAPLPTTNAAAPPTPPQVAGEQTPAVSAAASLPEPKAVGQSAVPVPLATADPPTVFAGSEAAATPATPEPASVTATAPTADATANAPTPAASAPAAAPTGATEPAPAGPIPATAESGQATAGGRLPAVATEHATQLAAGSGGAAAGAGARIRAQVLAASQPGPAFQGEETIFLQLDPEELGRVEVRLQARGDQLAVTFTATGNEAERALREGARELAETIAQRSGRFQQVDVRVEAREGDTRPDGRQGDRREETTRGSGREEGGGQRRSGREPRTTAEAWAELARGG